jgi:hypothetical protein
LPVTLDMVWGALNPLCEGRGDLAICAGVVPNVGVALYIRRGKGYKALPDLIVQGAVPQHFTFRRDGEFNRQVDVTLESFGNCLSVCTTSLAVRRPPSEFSFQQIQAATEQLTREQLETIKGETTVVPCKERTAFQCAFMRSLPQVMKIREIRERGGLQLLFSAYDHPSTLKVPPLTELINLDLVGHRLQEISMQYEHWTLRNLFERADLMSKYAVLILGSNRTTGYGKSALAKALATHYSQCWVESQRMPRDAAQIVITNTLDAARDVKWTSGMTWILDEFSPSDTSSNVYCSESILKVLFNPSEPCSYRARNEDVKICAGVPRVITSNATSLAEFLGPGIACSDPLKRKCIVFNVQKPLVSQAWVASLRTHAAADLEVGATSTCMSDRMRTVPVVVTALPASSSSSSCPLACRRRA